jgi:thiol peroxidase
MHRLITVIAIACLSSWILSGCQQHNSKGSQVAAASPGPVVPPPPPERTGLVTVRGKPLTLVGKGVEVGDFAPAFTAVANDMSTYRFAPQPGKVYILSAVPSLDTSVCSTETKHFNQESTQLGPNVAIVTVSMDLPFAQKRWCGTEGVKNLQTVSDSRDRSFAHLYGVQVKETGLLTRGVFVVGKDGRIAYVQLVPEITKEPDYAPVLEAVRSALSVTGAKS